jgi:hypothetical protein
MTKLSQPDSRSSISLHEMSEEDRRTYRRWARFACICYSVLVAGLLVVGLSTRQPNMRTATQGQTVDIGTNAKPAGQHHPGG